MTDTANLGLPCIEGSQAQKHVTHNEALRLLDTLVQLAVLDRDLTAPPGAPSEGESWIVKSGATGAWAGHAGQIASWQDGVWQFSAPRIGWLAYAIDEGALIAWDGSAWVSAIDALTPTALNNMTQVGIGTAADTTNPLSAKLNNALFAAKTVAEGGDGDLRYKLSKESAANTLSFLFQDNYSGRAEIGLTGDDDFHVKVSADGATWRDAIVIDKATGQVSFPQGGASNDLDLTLAELTLGVADALNTAQFIGASGNRFADSFDSLTYVDTGAASNLDSAAAGLLKPSSSGGADQIPTMTSGTTSGVSVSASVDDGGGNAAWKAGDKNTGTHWNASGAGPATWSVNFGAPKTVVGYTVRTRGDTTIYSPTAWALEGSTAAAPSTWVTVDTRSGITSWSNGEEKSFTPSSPGSYDNYRIRFTSQASGVQLSVTEITMASPGSLNNIAVTSTALTAVSAPNAAKLVARVKEVDSIALNTDLIFSVSRDGGTTWTAFTMTKKFTANSIAVYDSDNLDLSAQPSGTAIKWKIASANNKSFEIHDIYLYWS